MKKVCKCETVQEQISEILKVQWKFPWRTSTDCCFKDL